ncbi:hypothetical protein CYMTET_33134 [Cymbomonas tetramitiformis]|uniref:Uncharacterized protein n=1 Tax=Cymbomonas tetramitiformis TaxID=36881 RepID=A0AAE0KR68_9CHLO|nr:hypothetical protein CYMTET_33134 [Cymbomonas tetramitiformis]
MVIGLGPCLMAKVLSGFCVSAAERWVVGWAMVGRGEFAYLVAETATNTEYGDDGETFLSKDAFSVTVWALLMATISAPFMFRWVLQKVDRQEIEEEGGASVWKVRVSTKHHEHHRQDGVLHDLMSVLHELQLDVTCIEVHTDLGVDIETFTVEPWFDSLTAAPRMSGGGSPRMGGKGDITSAAGDTLGWSASHAMPERAYSYTSDRFKPDINLSLNKIKAALVAAVDDPLGNTTIEIFKEEDFPALIADDKSEQASESANTTLTKLPADAVKLSGVSLMENPAQFQSIYNSIRKSHPRGVSTRPSGTSLDLEHNPLALESHDSVSTWHGTAAAQAGVKQMLQDLPEGSPVIQRSNSFEKKRNSWDGSSNWNKEQQMQATSGEEDHVQGSSNRWSAADLISSNEMVLHSMQAAELDENI